MKLTHIIVAMPCLLVMAAHAETKQKLNIDAATVYLNGASLTSTAKVDLPKGEHEVVFTNVAGNVNAASFIVNATNGVVVEATTFQNNYLVPENMSPRVKEIQDSIEIETNARELINTKITVINEELAVLQNNRKVSGDNVGLSVAELSKLLDLLSAKMENYINDRNHQQTLVKKTDDYINRLRQQLSEEQQKGSQPGLQLLVKFFAEQPVHSVITVTYAITSAGWTPAYDIMADTVNGPVKICYKANVYQNSGVSWDNVKLSLSTGNPAEGMQAPVINPWYLALYIPAPAYNQPSSAGLKEVVVRAYKKPLIDKDEARAMPTQEDNDLAAAQPGVYQYQRGADMNISGARTDGTQYIIDGVQVQSSINNYTAVNDIGINASFDIDLPYTIPSDGKQHMVAIKKYEKQATYRYYAAPKLDKDAFLQAQLTGWEDMDLLPGQTNIFFEGAYVGQGRIDIHGATDTLFLSLGRDKKISIKREIDKTLRSVKTIGSNVREAFAYTITIRNTRKEPVNLVLEDQVPVSNDKDVVVEDVNTSDSQYNEKTGIMTWTLNPAANETKKLAFGYTVKYPKGKYVTGLR